jgi:hypothetical protein
VRRPKCRLKPPSTSIRHDSRSLPTIRRAAEFLTAIFHSATLAGEEHASIQAFKTRTLTPTRRSLSRTVRGPEPSEIRRRSVQSDIPAACAVSSSETIRSSIGMIELKGSDIGAVLQTQNDPRRRHAGRVHCDVMLA